MKHRTPSGTTLVLGLALILAPGVRAALIETHTTPDLDIPDDHLTGLASTLWVTSAFAQVTSVEVTVDISGQNGMGFNGDLFAYLVHGPDIAVLLNRPGRSASNPDGYSDVAGFQVTFADSAAGDIHNYQQYIGQSLSSPVTGTWSPDGRNTSPFTVTDQDTRNAMLNSFMNSDPNGPWTLFVADLSPGGLSRLDGWSLDIITAPQATVPEADSRSLPIMAGGALCVFGALAARARRFGRGTLLFVTGTHDFGSV